ncbi:hypothetical protein KSS87_023195 [Heliosperma pusillum]|nr:hypothetical protein KSS87_023195 [Heliosperma pusillum]
MGSKPKLFNKIRRVSNYLPIMGPRHYFKIESEKLKRLNKLRSSSSFSLLRPPNNEI